VAEARWNPEGLETRRIYRYERGHTDMKITKRRLLQIIREEKSRLIREQWIPMSVEPIRSQLDPIGKEQLAIVDTHASSPTVYQQVVHLVNAYLRHTDENGKPLGQQSFAWQEDVMDLNPKAIAEADRILNEKASSTAFLTRRTAVDDAILEFMELTMRGAEEVSSDRMAAQADAPPAWSGIKTSSFE